MNDVEFSDQVIDTVRATLRERYARDVEVELADSEMQLDPESDELTV